ncbi:MAG: hypothetical protein ACRDNK_01820 [Solirubrobacteraceae bacterium]
MPGLKASSPTRRSADAGPDAPQRLPRGRHGMTREQVTGFQRGRMLRAMAEAMAEQGYVAT